MDGTSSARGSCDVDPHLPMCEEEEEAEAVQWCAGYRDCLSSIHKPMVESREPKRNYK